MVGGINYANAIKSLWEGLCTVTVRTNTTSQSTGRAVVSEVDTCTNQPCRITFDTVSPAEPNSNATQPIQRITLFVDRTVAVPPGSKITVTQNGVTAVYEQSGKPAVYSVHQEIPLEFFKGWA